MLSLDHATSRHPLTAGCPAAFGPLYDALALARGAAVAPVASAAAMDGRARALADADGFLIAAGRPTLPAFC